MTKRSAVARQSRYGVSTNVGDTGSAERLVLMATSVFSRTKISLVFLDFSLGTQ